MNFEVESQKVEPSKWTDIRFGENYKVTFKCIDEMTLVIEPSGKAALQEMKDSLLYLDTIIADVFSKEQAYFLFQDMSNIDNVSREARRYFIEYVKNKQHLQGLIFYNASPLFKLSITLGKKLNKMAFPVEITDDLPAALRLIKNLLVSRLVSNEIYDDTQIANGRKITSRGKPLHRVETKPDWSYEDGGYRLMYEIVDGNILHGSTSGRLEKQHIEPSFLLKERIIKPIWAAFGTYYYVLNLQGSRGTGQKTRKKYIDAMMNLYRKYPFAVVIFYGTSKLLRAGINMTAPFVPFDVHVTNNFDEALAKIAKSTSVGTGSGRIPRITFFKKKQNKSENIKPYINELLAFLDTIDWTGTTPSRVGNIDPSHPFSPVYDAINLVKWELDDLISQRREAEERLKKAKNQAESANGAKSEFLANMSHELRTPLNHIIGFTEIVLDKNFGDLNEIQTEYLGDVHESSLHLLSLINDILDLSKVESGKLELDAACVNLREVLENSHTMIKEKALKHGIALTFDLNGIPDTIVADERKLKQIMYNLLSNAVKFTPDGGMISVTARTGQQEKTVPAAKNGDDNQHVEISVADNGIGLSAEDVDRIFRPFEQVETTSDKRFQGTGLGLSLTKSMVELHHGRIEVQSEGLGKGTVFRLAIPVTQ